MALIVRPVWCSVWFRTTGHHGYHKIPIVFSDRDGRTNTKINFLHLKKQLKIHEIFFTPDRACSNYCRMW
jgi:hypothetical protein